mgnify:CR=1 FL=1
MALLVQRLVTRPLWKLRGSIMNDAKTPANKSYE